MFRSILVPLDGSAYSEQALDLASWVARQADATVELCHVHHVSDPAFPGSVVEDETAVLSHLREYLGVLCRRLAHRLDRPVKHRIAEGSPVTGLIAVAREAKADLIVLTTHGHGGVAHAWLGATAEALARQAGTPLLLTRPTVRVAPEQRIRRVLIPLDGSRTAEAALDPALHLVRLAGAAVRLVAVVELPVQLPAPPGGEPVLLHGAVDPEERRARAREYLDGVAAGLSSRAVDVDVEIRDAISPATAILQASVEFGADAIAMATHGRSRLSRPAVGSVSDKVIRAAGVPVLLVPSRAVEASRPRRGMAQAAAGA
jgi:nucleotide-binding universal stress UspA family protein